MHQILLIFLSLILGTISKYFDIPNFGPNKPHLIYHLGERLEIAMNHGFGYWCNQKTQTSKMRLKYQNTKNNLYINMKSHNGVDHFEQQIKDTQFNVSTTIKYQLNKQQWQSSIEMQNYSQKDITWFTYFSIQNNHESYIDFQKLSSPKMFGVKKINNKRYNLLYQDSLLKTENIIQIISEKPIKFYGLSANISQTYDIGHITAAFKGVIEIIKYPNIERDNQSKLVNWQNKQIQYIQANKWEDKKYIYGFFYGDFSGNNKIEISNGSLPFDQQKFAIKKQAIQQKYFNNHPKSQFLRHVIFNIYGGMAFYQGKLLTQNSLIVHQHDFCYGFTPSRLIFPRSFLWDQGFHLSVVAKYQPALVLSILNIWFNKIDMFGWIGREQIRGFTMVSLMPDISFVYQDSFQMNPPTLFLPIQKIMRLGLEDEKMRLLMSENFIKLQNWYKYLKKTQSHFNLVYEEQLNQTQNYRWRCKDQCKKGNFMGSGLDDFPRTNTQTQISKQHVDIVCWLAFFAKNLETISKKFEFSPKIGKYYENQFIRLNQSLHTNYLDKRDLLFKDVVVQQEGIYIQKFVNHIGYINLFPFMLGMLHDDESNKLIDKTIEIVLDEKLLFSQDGIRSLSKSDELYGSQDNYWRGSSWININFLFLRACKLHYWHHPKVQKGYKMIRENVMNTIEKNYQESGYLYENYLNGKGNRGYPFYGWTSLVVNIITEDY